ncbi:MAG: cell division protein FtsL [Hyphomicrobiaceae bacterium]
MKRRLTFPAIGIALISALALYVVKYDTRRIDEERRRLEHEIADLERAIALDRAELANLARPGRIERLAAAHLKLAPVTPDQLGAVGDIPWREEAMPPSDGKEH